MIINPTAGGGRVKKQWPEIIKPLIDEIGIDYDFEFTSYPHHAIDIAKQRVSEGYEIICAIGGDGTANEVLNGILKADKKGIFAAIPLGSGDDIPTVFGIPEKDLNAAIQCLVNGSNLSFDVGYCVNADRYFAGAASMGFDAEVANRANRSGKKRKGAKNYQIAVFETILKFRPYDLKIIIDDQDPIQARRMLLAIGNGTRYGGGMHICPAASVQDGIFHTTALKKVSRFTLVRLFRLIYDGEHVYHSKVETFQGTKFFVESVGNKCLYQADGEILGFLPETFITKPRGITVRVPDPWISYSKIWEKRLQLKGKKIPIY
ncbi:diacylglycerol/lipid kinase family protein [Candidatus Hodarchaeum mangrovi]